ncbi:jouberin-like isoform X4 [Tribolium madens]|uniref:jouberin-like isoform X4 n=1 Tax=Tribolium madens TaxID=41895 RepID=UPI001CF72F8F|nr:jouberin-like isoform X4 [Tribolium madens]
MASNFDDCSSINSSSAHLSVRNQTREKFESLLKAAVHKKRSNKSREHLLKDLESPTESAENLSNNVEKLQKANENYILNKFLDHPQENQLKTPPVPKPRKKKPASVTSQRTFEVTSPKILKNNNESQGSNATFNVDEIGDVLVHTSPLKPKVIIKENTKSKFSESDESKESEIKENKNNKIKKRAKNHVDEVLVHTTPSKPKIIIKEKIKSRSSESDESQESEIKESKNKVKKKKKRKNEVEEEKQEKNYTYDKIVEITILKTDRLQLSSLVVHPIVKLHVIDAITGKYFPKSDKNRSVVFFYENNDNDYISPVMTRAYNLQEKRILYPLWEESILLNEDFKYFRDESNRIILFFELLDFVSVSTLQQLNQKECVKGWHNIAFAFLKLAGKNGELNIDSFTKRS